jgi:hypothetical protein
VQFVVTFSEAVSGVNDNDFSLTTSGLAGATVTNVVGATKTYTVTVNTGTGSGTLRLDVIDNDSITDGSNNPLGGNGSANGNFSTGELYTIDKIAPSAGNLSAANITTNGSTLYTFTITLSDNLAINSTSCDNNDIRVTGPAGFSQLATLVSISPAGNGTPRTATYQIMAPVGGWAVAHNGTYSIAVEAGEIFDTAGNAVSATTLGDFLVDLKHIVHLPIARR